MQALEWSKRGKIEDRTKVNIEPLCALPSEHSPATWKVVNCLSGKIIVIRSRPRPNVARWASQSARQNCRFSILIDSGYRIELWPVPICAGNCSDLTGIVQKTIRVASFCLEKELINDVVVSIPIIVDFDFILDVIAEFVEVWASCRLLKRNIVGD